MRKMQVLGVLHNHLRTACWTLPFETFLTAVAAAAALLLPWQNGGPTPELLAWIFLGAVAGVPIAYSASILRCGRSAAAKWAPLLSLLSLAALCWSAASGVTDAGASAGDQARMRRRASSASIWRSAST